MQAGGVSTFASLRHSLRGKLLAGYLLIVMLTVAVGGWAIHNLLGLSRALDAIMVENYRSILAAENMVEAIERQDSAMLLYLLGQESDAQALYTENEGAFLSWLARAEDNVTEPGEAEIVSRMRAIYTEYLSDFTNLRRIKALEGEQRAREYYLGVIWPRVEEIRQVEQQLLDKNHQAMLNRRDHATAQARKATWSTALVAVTSVILGLVFGVNAAAIIIGPARKLTESAMRIGQGHLDERIDIRTGDEIGRLAEEFNRMTERLRAVDRGNIDRLITERKRSEAVVNSIGDPLLVLDGEHRLVLVNPAAERVFGLDEDLVRGVHFLEAIHDPGLFEQINRGIHREPGTERPTVTRTVDGRERHFALEVTEIPGSVVGGLVILLQDVTHYREVDRMKSDFVSTVSHEFRTPLTGIAMGVGMLLERSQSDPESRERQLLQAVNEDAQRLMKLVNDLLDLSRMESGRIQMDFAAVRLDRLLPEATAPLVSQAAERGVEVTVEVPPDLPPAWADASKITWVISNLVGNAIRYTSAGGKITVAATQLGNRLHVSVTDTGVGIPESEFENIFRKFVQLQGPEGTTSGGVGLGLSIAREIVQAHGGRIWVESRVGEGSKFTFTLSQARTGGANGGTAPRSDRRGHEEHSDGDGVLS
ncbi:MAG: ATP-binding protein [Chloroflexota bacterium]